MKRVLFFLSFLVLTVVCFGQTKSDHMTFMGIPIDGTLESFSKKLQAKGYAKHESSDIIFHGPFADFYDCNFFVQQYDIVDKVCGVTVQFPQTKNWKELSAQFEQLKKMLCEEYGAPLITKEEFEEPNIKTDFLKFEEAQQGRIQYLCIFGSEKGTICLNIGRLEYYETCFVLLSYMDNANLEENTSKSVEELFNLK